MKLRQLAPTCGAEVDPTDAYADLPETDGRPSVRLNMIASLDGAVTLDDRAGPLGGEADRVVFRVLRRLSDVVLVGAQTVRVEGYRDTSRPLAIVTASCSLDWTSPLFTDPKERPIIVTGAEAPPDNLRRARESADVLIAGSNRVDLRAAVDQLAARGFRRVLCEGGPHLNTQLLAADVLDELCLTVSPLLAAGHAGRIIAGTEAVAPVAMQLHAAYEHDGFLFLRHRVARS